MLYTDPSLLVIEDLASILINDLPLMDVRAPIEFKEGAFPCATNLPLMDDKDREDIGKRYKQQGQDEAIALGLKRVSGDIKQQRVNAWQQFAQANPQGVLYCFRGGLRSRISQQWLYEQTGIRYPRIKGGYKALRRFLIDTLEQLPENFSPIVLTGKTGSGKTRLLKQLSNRIDLEQLANHRGSAFGPQPTPQPTQIHFENALAIQLLKQFHQQQFNLVFEDESRTIGSVHIPEKLFDAIRNAPLVLLEISNKERIEISYQEYVVDTYQAFLDYHQGNIEQGFHGFAEYLLNSLNKLQRRLGGVRYQKLLILMQDALKQQKMSGEMENHYEWVKILLLDYYDPMYEYQLRNKQTRLTFTGNSLEVTQYLQTKKI